MSEKQTQAPTRNLRLEYRDHCRKRFPSYIIGEAVHVLPGHVRGISDMRAWGVFEAISERGR